MNDLIKRQDAIDAVMKYGKQIPTFAIAVKDALENLPSAQPEPVQNLRTTCTDTISRQAAIELIHSLYPGAPIMRMNRKRWKKKYEPYIEAEKALEMLPSTHSERKRGKWIHDKPNDFKCSKCNRYLNVGGGNMKMNFCPNCGADMREGEEG